MALVVEKLEKLVTHLRHRKLLHFLLLPPLRQHFLLLLKELGPQRRLHLRLRRPLFAIAGRARRSSRAHGRRDGEVALSNRWWQCWGAHSPASTPTAVARLPLSALLSLSLRKSLPAVNPSTRQSPLEAGRRLPSSLVVLDERAPVAALALPRLQGPALHPPDQKDRRPANTESPEPIRVRVSFLFRGEGDKRTFRHRGAAPGRWQRHSFGEHGNGNGSSGTRRKGGVERGRRKCEVQRRPTRLWPRRGAVCTHQNFVCG